MAELCRRLDSLPLAVELAAARTSVLSPTQILERLSQRLDLLRGGRDAEARQGTLRATIAWSYELLDEEERRLFARLAVFAGGCRLEAAEEAAEARLNTLQSLVDKSLVRHTEERFWMLEMIREYALERLEDSGEGDALRRRHAEHVLALAEEAEPHLREESKEWLDRIEREHDNVRAALDRLEASGENDLVLRLAASVWIFWSMMGHLEEGRRRLEDALSGHGGPTAARANALMGAADFALDTGDRVTARYRAEEALVLQRTLGDAWGVAYSLLVLGLTYAFDGEWSKAQPLFDESMRLFRDLGDEHQTLQATRRLAWSYEELGDLDHARALQEDMLNRARASGDEFIEAKSLAVLAQYALDEGRVDRTVVSMLKAAHEIQRDRRELEHRYWDAVPGPLALAPWLAEGNGRPPRSSSSACFEVLFEETGVALEAWVARMNEVTLTAIRDHLDEATIAESGEQGRALTSDEAVALALSTPSADTCRRAVTRAPFSARNGSASHRDIERAGVRQSCARID